TFPEDAYPAIVYPIALTASAAGAAPSQLLGFLKGSEAKAVWLRHGFAVLP
ncbi:MAG: molybdate ABC transporter substrate-binding protein, partial [Methylocystis sp.]|nr:molybdate ABC transporter substrate-binding protein [Methylocystis sp.]